jgi:threonine/homoserine/homoserine lactone efflux protein
MSSWVLVFLHAASCLVPFQAGLGVIVGSAVWSSSVVLDMEVLFQAFPAIRLVLHVAGAV